MKKLTKLLLISFIFLIAQTSYAGKVDEVKKLVKEKCNLELSEESLLDSILKAYDCQPQADVSIQGCTIKCQKTNSGKVVGG